MEQQKVVVFLRERKQGAGQGHILLRFEADGETGRRVPFRDRQTQTSAHKPARLQPATELASLRYIAGNERKEST